MRSACFLHEAGVFHGDLEDGRHFVRMGNGIRIVDFSTAAIHRCRRGTPILLSPHGVPPQTKAGCGELLKLEASYGIFSGDTRV